MNTFPPGFVRQHETLTDYMTAQSQAATLMYREHHVLPHRLAAPSLIHPMFRMKADNRRDNLPGGTKRGASSVDALSLLDPADASVLIRRSQNNLEMTRSEDDQPTVLTRDSLVDLFDTDLLLVVTDLYTLAQLISLLDASAAGDKGNKLAKFVEWTSSNRLSSHVAVLTSALTQRFHAPVGMHTGKIDHWGKAFAADPETWDGLWALLRRCTADTTLNQTQVTCFGAIARDTAYALTSAWHHISNDAANSLFFLSRNVEKARSAAMSADPIRVREALRSGDACQIAPLSQDWPKPCAVSGPTRLKINTVYSVFDKAMERIGYITVSGLGVDWDTQTVLAELSVPTGKIGPVLSTAAANGQTFFLVEKLFLDSPSSRSQSPWTKSAALPPIPGRQVPLKVLLAGTPTA